MVLQMKNKVPHRRKHKRRIQWQNILTLHLSSILLVSTRSDAFLLPSASTTPRTALHAIHSTLLTTDLPILVPSASTYGGGSSTYTSVGSKDWNHHHPQRTTIRSTTDILTSVSSTIGVGGTLPSRRLSYDNRYGGRATTTTTPTHIEGGDGGRIQFADWNRMGGRNGILGFDVGLQMLPSPISSSSSSTSSTSSSSVWKDHSRRMDVDIKPARTRNNPNSPIKKQVLSVLETDGDRRRTNGGTTTAVLDVRREEEEDGTQSSRTRRTSLVPAWFPYIPTRSQIQTLNLDVLKDACVDRGVRKTGNKSELQERLLTWSTEQHSRRVLERNALHTFNGDPLHDSITTAIRTEPYNNENDNYDLAQIDPLISRRKALLTAKTKQSKKGVLGFDAQEAKLLATRNTSNKDGTYSLDSIPPSVVGATSNRHRIQQSVTEQQQQQQQQHDDTDEQTRTNNLPSSASPSKAYLSQLTQTFHDSPTTTTTSPNNYQIQQLYLKAKHADQRGNLSLARHYLTQLRQITRNNDSRILRRLSRLELQCGNAHEARAILQSGLRTRGGGADDAYLLQGLGNLDLARGDVEGARKYYGRAVDVAPSGYANPHHALGTLEHSRGNIRDAARILRKGLEVCPTNHRLHHALGDLYREAKMVKLAETEYKKGLECIEADGKALGRGKVRTWGKSFFYAALGYLEYDKGRTDACRKFLWRSIDHEGGNTMHAQGWLALAQLEESESRFDVARNVFKRAIENYERKRRITWSGSSRSRQINNLNVVPAKMGDKWLQVYNAWITMEENQGARYNELNNLYSRVAVAFPDDWKNLQRWAKLQVKHDRHGRARTLFELACDKSGSSNAEPYRLYAEFEMSINNHFRARSILFLGAQLLSQSPDGAMGNSDEFSKLYHTWGVCEWHLENLDRAETLFDHALRLTDSGEGGSEIRTLVLYSIARFLFHAREDYILTQHCVCLSLTETAVPGFGGRSRVWSLWADVAMKMDNVSLSQHCMFQAEKGRTEEETLAQSGMLDVNMPSNGMPTVAGPVIHQLLRRAPWHHKIAHQRYQDPILWYDGVVFPDAVRFNENYQKEKHHHAEFL